MFEQLNNSKIDFSQYSFHKIWILSNVETCFFHMRSERIISNAHEFSYGIANSTFKYDIMTHDNDVQCLA